MTKTNNTMFRRIVSLFMALLMCTSAIAGSAITAEAAYKSTRTITGRVNRKRTDAIYVRTNGKKAKLRVCTFTQSGRRTSGKLKVLAVTENGNSYSYSITGCNGPSSNSTNLTLPKGNTAYYVYIWRDGNSRKNMTNAYNLSVDFKTNCWHYY